ncbi:8486_t:CDS:1, partial [Gigaspora rosea]
YRRFWYRHLCFVSSRLKFSAGVIIGIAVSLLLDRHFNAAVT